MTSPLFIGMPVYNGENFLSQALDSLLNQTFTNWTLLISDNASVDATAQICQAYCRKDSRIHYFRQPVNIGAINNFKYLLEAADSKYFMWAAADDEWNSCFIETCVKALDDPTKDWAFTNIVNIDSSGSVIRSYPSFLPFSVGERYLRIIRYVLAPEIFGKASLIYSLYRLPKLKSQLLELLGSPDASVAGYDMIMNLAMLCQADLFIDERVLFRKRQVSNLPDWMQAEQVTLPVVNGTMGSEFDLYRLAMVNTCRNTQFAELVETLMDARSIYQEDVKTLYQVYTRTKLQLESEKSSLGTKITRHLRRRFSK